MFYIFVYDLRGTEKGLPQASSSQNFAWELGQPAETGLRLGRLEALGVQREVHGEVLQEEADAVGRHVAEQQMRQAAELPHLGGHGDVELLPDAEKSVGYGDIQKVHDSY